MHYSRTFTLIGIFCLCALLIDIQPSISVPESGFGSLAVHESAQSRELTIRPEPVLLARSRPEYDSLVLVGDVLLARNIEHLMGRHGATYPFAGASLRSLAANPFIVGNFEASVPIDHIPTLTNQLRFSVDPRYLPSLHAVGFGLVSLANNHAFDFGVDGYQNTVRTLPQYDISVFGHPRIADERSIHITDIAGVSIAIIALHELEKETTVFEFRSIMDKAKQQSEFQIVYVHWGTEYIGTSDARQRRQAEMFVAEGVNLIIGHHPHVVQEIDLIDGVPVLYSLGNYLFDQYFSTDVQQGLVVQLDFDGDGALYLHPVSSEMSLSQPRFMDQHEHARFLSSLAKKSHVDVREYVMQGRIPLELSVATSPKIAIINE